MAHSMTPEATEKLRANFPAKAIGKLPKISCRSCSQSQGKVCNEHKKSKCRECNNYITSAHIHLDYVGHAETTDRLLSVDPGWTWEPVSFDDYGNPMTVRDQKGNPVGMWIKLTVLGVTRYGYGSCDPGKFDAIKELIGDALRNAAMRFGVALDLWAKGELESNLLETSSSGEARPPQPSPETSGEVSPEPSKAQSSPEEPKAATRVADDHSRPVSSAVSAPSSSEGVEAKADVRGEVDAGTAEASSEEPLKTLIVAIAQKRISQGDVLRKAAELTQKSVVRKDLGTLPEGVLAQIVTDLGVAPAGELV